MHFSRKNKGFTLLEVAIGLAVVGIMMVPILQAYRQYRTEQVIFESKSAQGVIRAALKRYAIRHGHYPIPSPYNLKPGDTGFGREYTGTIDTCPAAGTAMNTVCRSVIGTRDVPGTLTDGVLIGTIPFATLGLPSRYLLDGYRNKFTYAVTENLTATATFNDRNGALRVIKRDGALINAADGDKAHYVIVSHGVNGVGAYRLSGTQIAPCTGSGKDRANCNNDGTFNSNHDTIGTDSTTAKFESYMSLVQNSDYFDDFLSYEHTTAGDIWNMNPSTADITSRNAGRVFVGGVVLTMPAKLSVTGNVRANRILLDEICSREDCGFPIVTNPPTAPNNWAPGKFIPEIITGSPTNANAKKQGGGINCGLNAMTGILYADEQCNVNRFPSGYYTNFQTSGGLKSCPAGQWARRTNGSGRIICETP